MNSDVQAQIRNLNKQLSAKEKEMNAAQTNSQRASVRATELRIAYECARRNDNDQVKALTEANKKVKELNKIATTKATKAMVAGREAMAAQFALEDAEAELAKAQAVVK